MECSLPKSGNYVFIGLGHRWKFIKEEKREKMPHSKNAQMSSLNIYRCIKGLFIFKINIKLYKMTLKRFVFILSFAIAIRNVKM